MEWMNRGNRPGQPVSQQPISGQVPVLPNNVPKKKKHSLSNSLSIGTIVLLVAVTVLIVALVALIAFGGWNKGEARYVDNNKMQAVFLNGGQVYFGKIRSLNSQYVRLTDIYYLRVDQQVQPDSSQASNPISLVKLGCELHGPEDQMIIKGEQVIFWENLKEDGQVTKAVADYIKNNPNGQICADQTEGSAATPQSTPATNTTPTDEEE